VRSEQRLAGVERHRRRLGNLLRNGLIAQCEEDLEDSLQRSHHMGFHATERTQAEAGQFFLQFAHIMPANRKIVDEVVGALAHRRGRGVELGSELLFRCQGRAA